MKKYLVCNWKCHKSTKAGKEWFDGFAAEYRVHPEIEVIVAPGFISLESLAAHKKMLNLESVFLAAQDVSPFPRGSYTGAVAADMIRGLAQYVIVGHSERIRYFHETVQDVLNKIAEAADFQLIPIVCLNSREDLLNLRSLLDIDCEKMIIAYTPVDALNFKIPEDPTRVSETVAEIAEIYPDRPIIYGGALYPGNVEQYLQLKELSGLFVGSAGLEVKSLNDIYGKVVKTCRTP